MKYLFIVLLIEASVDRTNPEGITFVTISHYKILEKLGEVPNFPTIPTAVGRVAGSLRERILRHVENGAESDSAPRHIPLNESTDSSSRRPSLGESCRRTR